MKSLVTITLCLLCSIAYAQPRQYLVAGQSNARGRGVAELAPKVDTLTSFEFRPDSNQLVPLQDPVGLDFGGFQAAVTGSPWPAFGKTYHDITADTTILIPAARGGSGVHLTSSSVGTNWSSIGLLYTLALFKTNQARAITNQELDGVIWLQGETDAARITFGAIVQDDYRDALIDLIERFRSDHGCHLPFYIILVGTNTEDSTVGYDAVRDAQREVADILPHTYLIHETAYTFPDSTWMSDNVHYSQDGYNNVGEVGATNLAAIEDMYYKIVKNKDVKICKGDSVMLTAPPVYQNYLWSNGDTLHQTYVTTGGRHTVTVTDDNGCSFPLKIDVASYPEQLRPAIDFIGNDTLCVGDEITLNASSTGLYHVWSNGANSNSITVDSTSDYFVQTYDLYGCASDPSDTISVVLTDIPAPLLSSNIGTNICEGDTAIISAPPGFDIYQWSDGSTTPSISVSNSGTFTCMIGNNAGCSSPLSSPINIQVNPIPTTGTILFVSETSFCEGDSATLTASSQQDNYLWSNGDTTKSITVYESGTYTFSFVNENGCMGAPSSPVEITAHPTPPIPLINTTDDTEFCEGESISLNALSGFSEYLWSNGATTQSITVYDTGVFSCVASNEFGCPSPVSNAITTIVNPSPVTPIITPNGATTFCEGDSVELSAPAGFMNYQWSNGDSTQSITVYDSNSFFNIITDNNGCISPISMPTEVIVNPTPAMPTISLIGSTILCEGDSLTLIASAGFSEYLWSNGDTTQSITISDTGLYNYFAIDSNGCASPTSEAIETTLISSIITPTISVSGATTFCDGESVTLTAPTGFANYEWSNGATTQNITITDSGAYTCVLITDSGCESAPSDSLVVTVNPLPATPSITPNGATTFCEGDSVILSASAGFAQYEWSNGDTTQNITIYESGTYECLVGNENGCTNTAAQSIEVEVQPIAEPEIIANGPTTFCDGASVALTISSDFSTYEWSNGDTTQSIVVYDSGIYTCLVTADNGCVRMPDESVVVTALSVNSAPVISTSISPTLCEGDTVILSAPDGFSDYEWSNGETTQNISVSTSGTFNCIVTNIGGCLSPPSMPVSVIVNPIPVQPIITANDTTTFCEGDSVILFAPVGFSKYQWSNGGTTQSIVVYDTGIYDCFVLDTTDCPSPNSAPIDITVYNGPPPQMVNVDGSTNFCEGETLTLSAPPGFLNYIWSNGDTTQNITVSNSGMYDFFIIDDNGCTSPYSNRVEVVVDTIPTAPVITVIGSTELCEGESVTLSMPPNYSYQWSNGDTTQTIIVYDEGLYNCTISDSNGCSSAAAMPVQILVNPLPTAPVIQSVGAAAFCEGDSVVLSVPGGYNAYAWSSGDTTQSITVYDTGTHYCTVSDFFGCQNVSEAFNTTMNAMLPTPEITYSGSTNFCDGGSVTLFAPVGYIYEWSNGETTQDITVTETSGPLYCVIMNNNGCISNPSDTTFVTVSSQSSIPTIEVLGDTILCSGESVQLSAPPNFDTYLWSNGQTTQNITVGLSGAYTVAVSNNDDCLSEYATPIEITLNSALSPPTISILGSTNFCEGDSVVLRALQDASGYLWSDGQTTQTISVSTSGAFSCILLDDIGCQSQSSITVNTMVNANPAAPIISVLGDSIICEGDTAVLSVPEGFDAYFWSNGAIDSSIDVTTAGTYTCYVVDENGCESPVSDEVTTQVRPLPPVLSIHSVSSFDFCEGDNITLMADANYQSYLWSTGDTSSTITVNSSGDFYYTAIDGISCRNPMSDTISTTTNPMPAMPVITPVGQDTLCASELAETYLWYRNDTLTTHNTQCIIPDLGGDWQVVVSIENCASSISEPFDFNPAGPVPPDAEPSMDIYPNPSNGFLTMQTINIFEDDATFEIYDMLGRLLYIEAFDLRETPKFEYTIDIRQLPDAPYVAVLRTKGTWRFAKKFIVDR